MCKLKDIFFDIDQIETLIHTEREHVTCLHVALIEAKDNALNYDMMISGIAIRLGEVQDKLNEILNSLSEVIRERKENDG